MHHPTIHRASLAFALVGALAAAPAFAQSESTSGEEAGDTRETSDPAIQASQATIEPRITLEKPLPGVDTARMRDMQQAREAAAVQKELGSMRGAMEGMPARSDDLVGPAGDMLGNRNGASPIPGDAGRRGTRGDEDPTGYGVDLPGNGAGLPGGAVGMPSSSPRDWMDGAAGSKTSGPVDGKDKYPKYPGDKKPQKPDKPYKPYKPYKPEKPDKPVKPVKPDKPDKPDKPYKPDKPDKPDKPVADKKPVKPGKDVTKLTTRDSGTGGSDGRSAPRREPTLVNPGNDSDGTQQVVRINPGSSIVTNPAIEQARDELPTADAIRQGIEDTTLIDPPDPDGPGG